MCVRAINLNDMKEDELRFRILAEIVGEDRAPKRADFSAQGSWGQTARALPIM